MLAKKSRSLSKEYEQLLRLNSGVTAQAIDRICRPIKDNFNTDAFFYSRLNKEGGYYHLGTRTDILEDYFFSEQLRTSPTLSRLYYTMTPTLKVWQPVDEIQQDLLPICKYFHRNKLNSGVTITVNHADFREMFYFGTHQEMSVPDEYWLNRVGYLYDFIKYFAVEAHPVLRKADSQQIGLSDLIGADFFSRSEQGIGSHVEPSQDVDKFREQLHHNLLVTRRLTKRETEILYQCILGKSAKQIANDFGLSRRTVETIFIRLEISLIVGQ